MTMPKASDNPQFYDVVGKEQCPKCGSPDNVKRYADGHAKCWSAGCDYYEPPEGTKARPSKPVVAAGGVPPMKPQEGYAAYPNTHRGIEAQTRRRYGAFLAKTNKLGEVTVYPYYSQSGELVAQKLRTKDKDFPTLRFEGYEGQASCMLFGQQVYGDKHDKRVIVTEGEEDAMAVAQIIKFRAPVVSVSSGSKGAKASLQANYRWLDRFSEIVLFFDDDEAGRAAAKECAPLFQTGKVKVAKADGFKDANEALLAGKPGDVDAAIWAATAFRPPGLINAADCIKDFENNEDLKPIFEYPWKGLNDALKGIRAGEVVYHVAGTGVGKSTNMYQIGVDVVRQGGKIAWLGFEGTRKDIQLELLSMHAGRRLVVHPVETAEFLRLHKEFFGKRKIELFDPETAEWTMEAITGYLRYAAKALECEMGVVDPFSFIAAGLNVANQVLALDTAAMHLAKLAMETGMNIQVGHHLARPKEGPGHEEGGHVSVNQIRGSGGLGNFAPTIIGWERNQQGDNPNLTRARVLKNRKASFTGIACVLAYDPDIGNLKETNQPFDDATEGGHGKQRGAAPREFGEDF